MRPFARHLRTWIAPLGALLLVGALAAGGWWFTTSGEAARAGDCVVMDAADTGSPFSLGDCADPAASFVVLGFAAAEGDCRAVPGAVRTTTQLAGGAAETCLGEKGVDPATSVVDAGRGDCLTSASDPVRQVPCADPAAGYVILGRFDAVNTFEVPDTCDLTPSATAVYTWNWRQESGPQPLHDITADAVFCLGPVPR
ncbi:hypothetical protein BJF78_02410 [Pseudonocardia sp. CNS-139]|nr:hypothetical protein BJF78_02410 [Pseudonocardia sp. CNS-139]